MSFFEELKRRNVVRVGIAYIIAAWLLLQLTDVLVELLSLPDTAGKFVVLLLIIGFVPALIFAWAFEMTPEGIKREKDVDRSESITGKTGRKLDLAIIGVLVVAVGYFIWESRFAAEEGSESFSQQSAGQSENIREKMTPTPDPVPNEPSIAVLPFVNMSADPEQEYFSDGISEEILNVLVRIEGLKVASRTSSFTYKGENLNIPEIAAQLKVDHILEGSVRKANNRVRITAQLIDTRSDRHLWSESFDRELVDIFAIQDEIANAIVAALKGKLGVAQKAISVAVATENLDAYDLYLKARGLFVARQDLALSIQLFEQATHLDSGFARAWEGLAAVHWVASDWLVGDDIDHVSAALQAAKHALMLDPDLSMPHAVLGMNLSAVEHRFADGMAQLDQAVAKDPKNATARLWRGIIYKGLGYLSLADADLQQCLEIDPGYMNCKQHLAETRLMEGQAAQAVILFEETIEANFHSTDESFVSYYLRAGQRTTALLLANTSTWNSYAPVKDWIRAIEHPNEDHSVALAHFREWSEKSGRPLESFAPLLLALDAFELVENSHLAAGRYIWHPDAVEFRKSEKFKQYVRDRYLGFWQVNGFPAQCRALGEEDFECD